MASLAEIRAQYPQYGDLSDQDLADRLYQRYYADMPREQFDASIGLTPAAPPMLNEQDAYDPFANEALFAEGPQAEPYRGVPDGIPELGIPDSVFSTMPPGVATTRQRLIDASDTRSGLQRFQEWLGGTVDASAHGLMLGGDDELTRLIFGEDAERQLEESQAEFAQDNPTAAAVSEVAGGLGLGAGAGRAGVTLTRPANPTALRMGARGAAEGAAYGGAYGFLDTEGSTADRLAAAGRGAVTGAAIGGPLGVIGSRTARAADDMVPTQAANRTTRDQLYGAVDNAGVAINGQAVFGLSLRVRQRLAAEGLDVAVLPPPVLKAIRLLDNASAGDLTLQSFDLLRQRIRDLSKKPSNRHVLGLIIDEMDGFANGLTAQHLVSGTPEAVAILQQARAAHVQVLRDALIAKAFRRAENRGGTLTAIQSAFRRIDENPADLRLFSTEEQRLIQRIIRGDNLDEVLSNIGAISSQGFLQSFATLGGVIPALARKGARGRTTRAAQQLARNVRVGGQAPRTPPNLASGVIAPAAIYGQSPPMLPGY